MYALADMQLSLAAEGNDEAPEGQFLIVQQGKSRYAGAWPLDAMIQSCQQLSDVDVEPEVCINLAKRPSPANYYCLHASRYN